MVFLFGCFLWVVFLFWFVLRFVWFTALGQLYGLCKGPHLLSFAAFPIDGIACFSQLISGKYKLVERPGESHEGVGRKKNMPVTMVSFKSVSLKTFSFK